MGIHQANKAIQRDSLDVGLRNALWNVFKDNVRWDILIYLQIARTGRSWNVFKVNVRRGMSRHYAQKFGEQIWKYCFNKLLDEVPYEAPSVSTDEPFLVKAVRGVLTLPSVSTDSLFKAIKEHYLTLEWYEVYDFIDFVANHVDHGDTSINFIEACNAVLKRELSDYRFVEKKLVPVTSEQEIAEINEALSVSRTFTPHLERALNLLADRKSPDYANIIKESISAVEATCKWITGDPKATLGQALGRLESKGIVLHADLKEAFKKLYGYTSDAQGIRHGLVGKADLDIEDARFMLSACSAFINYLVVKADKAGIQLPDK